MTQTERTPKRFTIQEFHPADGYFALILDEHRNLVCKAYTPLDARCIVEALNAARAALAKARSEGRS